MFTLFPNWLRRIVGLGTRAAPVQPPLMVPVPTLTDAYRRLAEPTPTDLMAELRNTAWACATLNASVCASLPPRLFVRTAPGQSAPRCHTRALSPSHPLALAHRGESIEEVRDHPVLDLFTAVNPLFSAHDLWELTTLYQEVTGSAYWLLDLHPTLGVPAAIWPLPAHLVRPVRKPNSTRLVDCYELRQQGKLQQFEPERIVHFRYPDPREPYLGGLSPLKACWEAVTLQGKFLAYKRSLWDNAALPGVILSPQEALSPQERERLETAWNARFRKGGNGRVLVSETGLNVEVLHTSLADVAALAEVGATQADIANAFGVPLAFLTTETNLANLQAADEQHASKAIRPRLSPRDEKLNEHLLPLYDPTGRLFFATDDPTPTTLERQRQQEEQDLRLGVRTVNEVRTERGLPPVAWGDQPLRYQEAQS